MAQAYSTARRARRNRHAAPARSRIRQMRGPHGQPTAAHSSRWWSMSWL